MPVMPSEEVSTFYRGEGSTAVSHVRVPDTVGATSPDIRGSKAASACADALQWQQCHLCSNMTRNRGHQGSTGADGVLRWVEVGDARSVGRLADVGQLLLCHDAHALHRHKGKSNSLHAVLCRTAGSLDGLQELCHDALQGTATSCMHQKGTSDQPHLRTHIETYQTPCSAQQPLFMRQGVPMQRFCPLGWVGTGESTCSLLTWSSTCGM